MSRDPKPTYPLMPRDITDAEPRNPWRERWDPLTRELVREESINGKWVEVSRKLVLAEPRK